MLNVPKVEAETVPNSLSLGFIEGLYADFLADPSSVSADWREYFQKMNGATWGAPIPRLGPSFRPASLFNPPSKTTPGGSEKRHDLEMALLQDRVDQFVRAFRVRGHMVANIDPLGMPRAPQPELDPEYYGFTEADMDRRFSTDTMRGPDVSSLRRIYERLRNTYCRSIGVQFMHMDDLSVRQWLLDRMEGTENRITLDHSEQVRIFRRLTSATLFEEFIQKRFTGAKSFSLEGAESLIPLLDLTIEKAGDQGIKEVVFGMAHRGRLNVLANIMHKSAQDIFREFADMDPKLHLGRGDVKYHMGYSSDWITQNGQKVHLSLCFNPSHLEFVNPVALGRLRAKQDLAGNKSRDKAMTLLIHGDAAFAGEGVVQEMFNMSQLQGYSTGGTMHVVVNNQIGFVTSPAEGRSTTYATDIAKMLQIPIFHVNGEDPEAVAQVVRLAMDFRMEFKRDVVIDMYCYRRRGHNEGDEPSFTHPLMYKAIKQRKPVRESYFERLRQMGEITKSEADAITKEQHDELEHELTVARSNDYVFRDDANAGGIWAPYVGGRENDVPDVATGAPLEQLRELLLRQTQLPEDFHPNPKVISSVLEPRAAMARGEKLLDWASAESLAFATLALEGHRVRMSGQDCTRGTFGNRHALLHDYEDGHRYMPLQHLSKDQAPIDIYNSPLSEIGVLGFEYGFSLDCPDGLVIWEAQFGDFVNVAQVIIDQFIASAESKWRRLSGIVLLLPHGFEGQGPEHSSARLERFLELGADHNIQVVHPTTPAQYFHLLRRQVLKRWRKPLIVMAPKLMLRAQLSSLDELTSGTFRRVIPDSDPQRANVEGVLMCSGKIYFELEKEREDLGRHDVAIVRMEQIYPLPLAELKEALAPYPDGTPVYWVQEEPENMGAWRFLLARYGTDLFDRLPFSGIYRRCASSPATGSKSSHLMEQKELLMQAFGCI